MATRHSFDGRFVHVPERIKSAVERLNEDLCALDIRVNVLSGMEVRVAGNLSKALSDGKLLLLNGDRHMLLQFHPVHVPVGFENLVQDFLIVL